MAVQLTSWEFEMELVDMLRRQIDEVRETKLRATALRNSAKSPKEHRKFDEIRCLLSAEEERVIQLYGKFLPQEMLTVN